MKTLALAVTLAATYCAPIAAQEDPLHDALVEQSHQLSLDPESGLSGAGAELLLREASQAQFVLLGEDHGVAEIPQIAAALLRELQAAGFESLALEIGHPMAQALESSLREDPSGAAYVELLRAHWPGTAFYTWNREAELLREAVALHYALWGLDYDILGDRYALQRLRELAPDDGARDAADRAIAMADAALETALAEQNPGRLMMFGGPEEIWVELREAFAGAGEEATSIVDLLQETRAINALFQGGEGYESNRRRALWNKQQFGKLLREASDGEGLPKVVLKFGANHMMRGRTPTSVFDLGTVAAELAELNGGHSFAVYLSPGRGTQQAVLDPRDMGTAVGEVEVPSNLVPLYDAARPEGWTLFDLRPLRKRGKLLAKMDPALRQVVFGYDAVVVLAGSTAQESLELR